MKYLPSVDRAALAVDTMAVPADPVNPEMNSARIGVSGEGRKPHASGNGSGSARATI